MARDDEDDSGSRYCIRVWALCVAGPGRHVGSTTDVTWLKTQKYERMVRLNQNTSTYIPNKQELLAI